MPAFVSVIGGGATRRRKVRVSPTRCCTLSGHLRHGTNRGQPRLREDMRGHRKEMGGVVNRWTLVGRRILKKKNSFLSSL